MASVCLASKFANTKKYQELKRLRNGFEGFGHLFVVFQKSVEVYSSTATPKSDAKATPSLVSLGL